MRECVGINVVCDQAAPTEQRFSAVLPGPGEPIAYSPTLGGLIELIDRVREITGGGDVIRVDLIRKGERCVRT